MSIVLRVVSVVGGAFMSGEIAEAAVERCVIAVPARLESSRLPRKVLAEIGGKPMLRRVLERCSRVANVDAVVLCTDSDELRQLAEGWGFLVLMTSVKCSSGSERIASVVDALMRLVWIDLEGSSERTAIINVQGDQPFLDPSAIDEMVAQFNRCRQLPSVVTPVYELGPESVHDPNIVKALLANDGRALYFSRSALPHVRDAEPADWHRYAKYWGHVGVYGFRADVLLKWGQLPASPLEGLERLEQLRWIEAGYTINTYPVSGTFLSVDTFEQLEQARAMV